MFGQGINFGTLAAAQVVADFLAIAGGGAGGSNGGGGGAGGLRTSYGTSGGGGSAEDKITLTDATTYTFTVGAGAVETTTYQNAGASGVTSSIAASGLTTISTVGGGGGGSNTNAALTGGSGGGSGSGSGGSTGGSGVGLTRADCRRSVAREIRLRFALNRRAPRDERCSSPADRAQGFVRQ